jgi:hypothetical protein
VQILVQKLVITYTKHIQKLDTENLWILRYHRSWFFTFLFFVAKILGNSLDKFNKSCIPLYQESRKIEFAFSDFSTIF